MVRLDHTNNQSGFTFIELVIVIIIMGLFVTVAAGTMDSSIDASRQAQTEEELNRLAVATVGNEQLTSGGMRSDFGYVGDIGALPPSLDYLATNPGGFATWRGPYIRDNFIENSNDFKVDPWDANYVYSAGVTIQSTGSGSSITKQFANSAADILSTPVIGVILDRDGAPPGSDATNVLITVSYPNGAGGTTSTSVNPNSSGAFSLSGIPIGNHSLTAIYTTANDTALAYLSSLPRVGAYAGVIRLGSAYWADTSGAGGGASSEILRPIAQGAAFELINQNCSENWFCVSEAVSDDDGTYVQGNGSFYNTDKHITQNSSVGSGSIDSVVIYINCYGTSSSQKAKTFLLTQGEDHLGPIINLSSPYTIYSTAYANNPATSSPWTWSQVDAMEIGVSLKQSGQCTQVWAEVFYQ